MRSWFKCCLILLVLGSASGCSHAPELQNFAYVTGMGIDYRDGKWSAYAQILNFTNIASTEKLEIGKPVDPWIGRGEGDTVTLALGNVGRSSQLRLFWGHVKVIIMTEAAMKRGVDQIHNAINRYREVRYNVLMYGTKEKLEDIFSTKSLLNLSPLDSLLFTGAQLNAHQSFIIPNKVNQIMADVNEPGQSARIASIGFNSKDWSEGKKAAELFSLNGVYYFRDDRMIAWMPVQQLKGIRWAEARLDAFPVQIGSGNRIDAVIVFNHPRLKIRPVIQAGEAYFDVRVKAEGYVLELVREATVEQLEAAAARVIRQDIRHTFLKGVELRCDPMNLQQELYRSKPSLFRKLAKSDSFFLTDRSLRHIAVQVNLTGMGKYKGRKG